jgi:predicted lipoprotein with Yx(FWY)xxD motif
MKGMIAVGSIVAVAAGVGVALTVTGSHHGGYSSSAKSAPSTAAGATATRVGTAQTRLGPILVDGSGRSLYLFESDPADKSICTGACTSLWPPLTATANVHATGGAAAGQLGALNRTDGSMQVSYHGHPLYYFAGDHKPGDITGEGLNQFGGSWDVISPAGNKIENGH